MRKKGNYIPVRPLGIKKSFVVIYGEIGIISVVRQWEEIAFNHFRLLYAYFNVKIFGKA